MVYYLRQHPDLDALLNIADQLDISPMDLNDGKFYVPKYRLSILISILMKQITELLKDT